MSSFERSAASARTSTSSGRRAPSTSAVPAHNLAAKKEVEGGEAARPAARRPAGVEPVDAGENMKQFPTARSAARASTTRRSAPTTTSAPRCSSTPTASSRRMPRESKFEYSERRVTLRASAPPTRRRRPRASIARHSPCSRARATASGEKASVGRRHRRRRQPVRRAGRARGSGEKMLEAALASAFTRRGRARRRSSSARRATRRERERKASGRRLSRWRRRRAWQETGPALSAEDARSSSRGSARGKRRRGASAASSEECSSLRYEAATFT